MMHDYGDHMSGWGWGFMGLTSLLLIALLALAVVLLSRVGTRPHGSDGGNTSSAPEVLAMRFARGEIDETEYAQRLTVLRGHGQLPTH